MTHLPPPPENSPNRESPAHGDRLAALRIEEFKYFLEEQRHLWLSGKEWALTTVRLLLTANGGAIVAILALMGAISQSEAFPSTAPRMMGGIICFSIGVLAATIASGLSTIYFSMLWRALPRTDDVERETVEQLVTQGVDRNPYKRDLALRDKAGRLMIWSMATSIFSAILFVAGATLTASGFLKVSQLPVKAAVSTATGALSGKSASPAGCECPPEAVKGQTQANVAKR